MVCVSVSRSIATFGVEEEGERGKCQPDLAQQNEHDIEILQELVTEKNCYYCKVKLKVRIP